MPIYPGRKPQVWRVIVTANGRNFEESFHGTRAEALEHEAHMRLAIGAHGRQTPARIAPLFSTFCVDEYAPYARAHLGAATWTKVRRYQVATLAEFFGAYRLTEFSTALVDAYKAHRRRTVRPSSVNNELRVLATMLRWARDDRDLPVATFKIRKLPVSGERRVHAWTAAEVGALYAAARATDPGLLPMIVFLLNTGCRKGEAIAAERTWVDPGARMLRIPVTEFWRPKSGKPREVPIGDALAPLLRAATGARWLFPNANGERFVEFPNKRFAAIVRAAALTGGPHTCRHTYASHFLRAVPDLFELARVLGHSHVRITELYTHLLPGHLDRARNAVNLAPAGDELGHHLDEPNVSS